MKRGSRKLGPSQAVAAIVRAVRLAGWMTIVVCLTAGWGPGATLFLPDQGPRQSLAPTAIPAGRQAKNVAIITLHGHIDQYTEISVKRRLSDAASGGADAVVIDLDVQSGELGAAIEVAGAIRKSAVSNTVAWINGEVRGVGVLVALACRDMVVSPNGSLGPADIPNVSTARNPARQPGMGPRRSRGGDVEARSSQVMMRLVEFARAHGRDEMLVQAFAFRNVELFRVQNRADRTRVAFVTAEQHRRIFGAEPPSNLPVKFGDPSAGGASAPRAVGPPAASGSAGPASGGSGQTRASGRPASGGVARGTGAAGVAPQVIEPGTAPIEPATPGLTLLAEDINRSSPVVAAALARPADGAGAEWMLLDRATDGRGLLMLSDDQLLAIGLASPMSTAQPFAASEADLKAYFGASSMARLEKSVVEIAATVLNNWVLRGVLVVVFVVSLVVEMLHPGLVLPGSVAAISLLLLVGPAILVGLASWWGVIGILLGVVLIAMEIFILPGFGVFGVLGMVFLFGGLLAAVMPSGGAGLFPDSPEGRSELIYGLTTLLLAMGTAGGCLYFLSKHLPSIPLLNRLVLQAPRGDDGDDGAGLLAAMGGADGGGLAIGHEGVALTDLRPAGRVQFGERIVDVVSESGYLPAGASVRVRAVSPFRVAVESVSGGSIPSSENA